MRNKELIKTILDTIEEHIEEPLSLAKLANLCFVSEVYIRKLFTALFHMPVSLYIRKRKLSLSAQLLQDGNQRILDIALQFGFQHEQSYIHAFKQEYGMTPYQWKKAQTPLLFTEQFSLAYIQEVAMESIILPSFVLLPVMCFAGEKHTMGFVESHDMAPRYALAFWKETAPHITAGNEPGVYYGITMNYQEEAKISDYYSCIQVETVQESYELIKFPAARYLRFSYVGNHSYEQLSVETAQELYERISSFFQSEIAKEYTFSKNCYFERVDTTLCDDHFCVMEWYIPIE